MLFPISRIRKKKLFYEEKKSFIKNIQSFAERNKSREKNKKKISHIQVEFEWYNWSGAEAIDCLKRFRLTIKRGREIPEIPLSQRAVLTVAYHTQAEHASNNESEREIKKLHIHHLMFSGDLN